MLHIPVPLIVFILYIHYFISFIFHFISILHLHFISTHFIINLFKQILWQLPVGRISLWHFSWVLSQPSSLAVALNFAEHGLQGFLKHSALCDVIVFIFM